jgi:putative ABC transport system permease protein
MFRNEMNRIPGVRQFCVSSTIPGKPVSFPGEYISRKTTDGEQESFVYRINIDAEYIGLYGLELIAGENFKKDHHFDQGKVILSRSAARSLGFTDVNEALGEFINAGGGQFEVIGVVDDYHHLSLKSPIMPLVFFKSLRWRYAVGYYSFSLTSQEPEIIEKISRAWSDVYPYERFIHTSMDAAYFEQYDAEKNFSTSFLIAAILAIAISCLGLYGLSRYSTLTRTREIGIRKTMGATSRDIQILLQSETFIIILIAALAGTPAAWYLMDHWLRNFVYRIDLEWLMFLPAPAFALVLAFVTVFYQTLKASKINPAESLRYE